MMTGNALAIAGLNIALFAKRSENGYNESVLQIASGKRINQPSDGISDYFFSDKMMQMSRSYSNIMRNISEGMAFLDVAVNAGEKVFNAVSDMKKIVKTYYNPSTKEADREALKAEFYSLKETVGLLIETSMFDGMQLISDNGGLPFKSISLENGKVAGSIDVEFDEGDIPDISKATLGESDMATEMTAIEEQLRRAGSYLAKAGAYMRGLNAHYNLIASQITTTRLVAQRSVESDPVQTLLDAMNYRIRTESSMAMFAQANMYRASVMKLFA